MFYSKYNKNSESATNRRTDFFIIAEERAHTQSAFFARLHAESNTTEN